MRAEPQLPPSASRTTSRTANSSISGRQDSGSGGETARWRGAVGNIEDARVALDTLARAIDDAVYLDEDAYNQVAPIMQYQKTIQGQQQRVTELSLELQESHAKLAQCAVSKQAADQRVMDLTQEQENNAVVFNMHYTELLAKEEEISRLKAIIQGLTQTK